jgi:hypothetical protein
VALETVTPSRQTIGRLLEGAERRIRDARSEAVSAETRFASAYGAIRMLAKCVAQAEALHATTIAWITTHRPKLA